MTIKYIQAHQIGELLKFVNGLKPEMITIFTSDMHSKIIVSISRVFFYQKNLSQSFMNRCQVREECPSQESS